MDQLLSQVLSGQEGNHLLPFLWMRDGHSDELPGLVESIRLSGARAFCVESRTHEQFCRDGWWKDMDIILSEAEKRNMKVWILDDRHFPTGFANGAISEKYPEKRKWQLVEDHVDIIGPMPQGAVLLREQNPDEDILLGVFAYHRSEPEETLDEEPIDLTGRVKGRYVFWDVPEGVWRVFALYKSRRGGASDYIHMLDPDSVRVLIDEVYEPHYTRYQRYFGTTISGFFSDEPSLGNKNLNNGGAFAGVYDQKLGQPGLALPWTDEVRTRMEHALGGDILSLLPGLWYPLGGGHPEVRIAYMDAVTQLWREAFSLQLGDWCRAHNVEYIGHIIEDMNAHQRLGCSAGHYFRALDGQDMAGIDVVLHQIMPGMAHFKHTSIAAGGFTDPEFFDYMLARLAASHSHIQPRMRGRAMCEIFGAYGWAEGVPFMKNLLDHMLVRGINQFVPHAFSPDFPDPDCPPHFTAGGRNPEFEGFARLMRYANQTADLTEGTEIVSAAILYAAEAEWSGRPCMLSQVPAKALYDAQLNYDILPIDTLTDNAEVRDGILCVEDMRYAALLVPYAAYLPESFLARLAALEAQGLKLAFVSGRPEGCTCGTVIKPEDAAGFVRLCGGTDIRLCEPFPLLRFRHARRAGTDVFMFVNESMTQDFDGTVSLPVKGRLLQLGLLQDSRSLITAHDGNVHLTLCRGESILLLSGDIGEHSPADAPCTASEPLNAVWKVSMKSSFDDKGFSDAFETENLYNITGADGDPGFCGFIRYETDFDCAKTPDELDLGLVGECAHVYLNNVDMGIRIAPPYRFDLRGVIAEKSNHLTVEISNSVVHACPDEFSLYMPIAPSGLIGPVTLNYR